MTIPISASQMPVKTSIPVKTRTSPPPMNRYAKPWPSVAAKRVAEARLPVRHQAIARTIRPPSIGNAGSRLKTRTRRLIEASQATIASRPEVSAVAVDEHRLAEVCRTRRRPGRQPPGRPTIASVTAGPAIATLNSVEGLSVSRSSRARPPKIQSWMLEIPIPLRSATKACPSSCRTIEPKNPIALATASA